MVVNKKEHTLSTVYAQPTRLLLLAVWFALLTGFVEVLLLSVKKFFLHQMIFLSPHVVWMAPLGDVFLFTVPGLILFLGAWRWPRFVSLRIVIFIFAFLSFLGLLFMWSRMHHYAALLLAAGLAVQIVRLTTVHTHRFYSLVRCTTGWMVTLVVGLAVGVHGLQGLAEQSALAKLPPASPDMPNVLLIVLDTVRAQSLSLYGYTQPTTPQLEQLAKIGVRFERALSTSSWTFPSHASMFTGRFPNELSADWLTPLDSTYPTLAEVLSAHGYLTAGFVANVEFCGYETGLNRGFAHYEDYRVSPWEIFLSTSLGRTIFNNHRFRWLIGYYDILGRKTAATINRDFLQWLSRNKDGRPFFAFLNYYDAHEPYLPPKPFDAKFRPTKTLRKNFLIRYRIHSAERSEKKNMSLQEIQAELNAYEGSIAYLDYHLGLLFNELQTRGLVENTLIIITSDHGEQFGEHGLFSHGNSLYLPVLHVPLLILFPSHVLAGKNVSDPVTLRDLPATIIDFLKLENVTHFPGTSLARFWNAPHGRYSSEKDSLLLSEVNFAPRQPEWYPISKGDMKSLVVNKWHYIRNGDGREELYNFENDPLEKKNLIHFEKDRQALAWFRTSLETILQRSEVHFTGQP